MSSRTRRLAFVALALAAGTAACGSDSPTTPGSGLNAQSLNAAQTSISAVMDQPVITGFFGGSGAGPVVVSRQSLQVQQALASTRLAAAAITRARTGATLSSRTALPKLYASAPLIPDSVKGLTFVHDSLGNYVVDTLRVDAPASGVRFIVYKYDTTAFDWTSQEIGYLDVMDSSTVSQGRLVVDLVGGGTKAMHYVISGPLDGVDATATSTALAGYITNGTQRLNFSVDDVEDTTRQVLDFSYELPAAQLTTTAHVIGYGLESGDVQSLALTVKGTKVEFSTGAVFDDTAAAYVESDTTKIAVNGQPYAIHYVAADGQTDVWEHPDGSPLSEGDVFSLYQAVALTLYAFVGFSALVLTGFLIDGVTGAA